jgi:hypothetical protein
MKNTYFAITTFGWPSKRFRKVHISLDSACTQASALKGSGTCSDVHVLAFETRAQAADADISDHTGDGVVGRTVAVY